MELLRFLAREADVAGTGAEAGTRGTRALGLTVVVMA